MPTRQTIKNRINKIIRTNTSGLFNDDYWQPVHSTFKELSENGYDVIITKTEYRLDEKANPKEKVYWFEIPVEGSKKPLFGILTCHGAGTVDNPLESYDISAYVS